MKNFFHILPLILILNISFALAAPNIGEKSFMPKNSMRIPVNAKIQNNMTKETFEAIINRVFDNYSPIIQERGATFVIDKSWEDETVNAYANQYGTTWIIYMFGGLARHELITEDGFMLVVCHETGHHVGGAPKYYGYDWASNEGQSDYFGTLKCMKRVLEKDDNISIVAKMTVDDVVTKKCTDTYITPAEVALCQRISMAAKSVSLLLASLNHEGPIAFDTPDLSVVKETYDNHPKAQCRLDTFFSGALCTKPFSEDVSDTNPGPGTCLKSNGYTIGFRPLCWYKPGCDEVTGICMSEK